MFVQTNPLYCNTDGIMFLYYDCFIIKNNNKTNKQSNKQKKARNAH